MKWGHSKRLVRAFPVNLTCAGASRPKHTILLRLSMWRVFFLSVGVRPSAVKL